MKNPIACDCALWSYGMLIQLHVTVVIWDAEKDTKLPSWGGPCRIWCLLGESVSTSFTLSGQLSS